MIARLAAAALLLAAAAGCGTAGAPHPAVTAPPAASTAPAATAAPPTTIDVPRLGLHAALTQTGLNPDHTLQVPPLSDPMQVAWYRDSSVPGTVGQIPAIVLAHVNAHGHPGAFAHLDQLRTGDTVTIGRDNAAAVVFVVDSSELDAKTSFPTDHVYGHTADPQLRLITCGGELDRAAHSYLSNRVVFAHLVT